MLMNTDLRFDDCLLVMPDIPDNSIDMVLCDLPYGTTACKWDAIIPFDKLWKQYARIVKPHGAVVLTATQPFTSALVMSNPSWFRHEWIWDKVRPSGMQIAKYRPMQRHESVLVFSKETPNYYPQMAVREEKVTGCAGSKSGSSPLAHLDYQTREYTHKNPQSILSYRLPTAPDDATAWSSIDAWQHAHHDIIDICKTNENHETEKPVALMSFFIQTYSRVGDTVLDNTMGSGSTGCACVIEQRKFIGIEKDEQYFAVASRRIASASLERGHYIFGVSRDGSTTSKIYDNSPQSFVKQGTASQPDLFGAI